MIKKSSFLLITLIFLICPLIVEAKTSTELLTENSILETYNIDTSKKIYDYDNLLTDSQETYLFNSLNNYTYSKNYIFLIATINDQNYAYLDNNSFDEFANSFFNTNSKKKDGLLLLIDQGREEYKLYTFGKASETYNSQLIDYLEKNLKTTSQEKNIYSAITNLVGDLQTSIENNFYETSRTKDNLGISSDIKVTDENLEYILNTPKVDASQKIYDFANLFTEDEEKKLYDLALKYIKKTDIDLAIVTIDYNPKSSWNGQSPTTVYADDFHDYNDFKEDGIVILIDMENRIYWVSTSGKAIEKYNDKKIDKILDAGESSMKNGNYFDAARKMTNSLIRQVPYLVVTLISLVISSIVTLIIVNSYKKIKLAVNANCYLDKEKTKINNRVDQFINSTTSKIKIESSSSSSGGGGSSSHSGSSGSSHGGGGRGF